MLLRIYVDAAGSWEHEEVAAYKTDGGCLKLLTQRRTPSDLDDGLRLTKVYGPQGWYKLEIEES